ncbi:MAG: mucoidy inhibitor MuiA family protein [Candidatus Omnitrophota bacterium]
MKNRAVSLIISGFFVLSGTSSFADQLTPASSIKEVTVYPDSALVSRSANVQLGAGAHEVVFSDIIPEIDENSLKVSCANTASVKILGARLKREFLTKEPAEKVRELQDQIQKIEDEIKKLQNFKEVLANEKEFLDSIRMFSKEQLPKELVTKMPAVKDMDDTLKFMDTRLKDNYSQALDTELQIREQEKKLEALRKELADISGPRQKMQRSIIVEVEAAKTVTTDLVISYLVGGATWQPIYDARANFEKSQVELVSYGIIRQRTGEDWQNVEISLSTAKPAVGGRMPYVESWLLKIYQPRPMMLDKERGVFGRNKRAFLQYEAYSIETKSDVSGVGGEGVMPQAPVYSHAQEKGIAVVYKLTQKASVKSDGTEEKFPISTQTLKASFEYSTYPKALLNAYLGSRVLNAPDLQLLAGRVNIFLDGDFVGISSIDNIAPQEEFDLYLGADENVKVKRELIEKKVDETIIGNIPSPNRRTIFKYKLTVENYKSKAINVKLFEAMPVSQDDRIKVRIDKVSVEPTQKDWKDRKGVWLWELALQPQKKQEITYTFLVEHPRDLQIEGL